MTASFTWGTEKCWQLLNVELQEILMLGLQNLTLSRVQILLETNSHFDDQFKWSYFKPMYTLLTWRCPPEQEEVVFWKKSNQIDQAQLQTFSSMRFLSPDWLSQLLPLEVHFAPSSTNYFSNMIMLHICNLSWISITCWVIPCVLPSFLLLLIFYSQDPFSFKREWTSIIIRVSFLAWLVAPLAN